MALLQWVSTHTGWWSEIPWVTSQHRQSNKWCRLNNSAVDTEADLAFIGIRLRNLLLLESGKQNVCILRESKRSWRVSLVDGKIKWGKKWRENNDIEHGEGGAPPSIYSYLWQASPLGRFFQESWPTSTTVNAFVPEAYIIHSCQSFYILHIGAAVLSSCWGEPSACVNLGR